MQITETRRSGDGTGHGVGFGNGDFGAGTLRVACQQVLLSVILTLVLGTTQSLCKKVMSN